MKVEWTNPENYYIHYCKITLYNKKEPYELYLADHTCPEGMNQDIARQRRNLKHAYTVSLPFAVLSEPWLKLGFESSYYDTIGIDLSENLDKQGRNVDNCYIGTPKHTLEEVKDLVIKGFIDSFQFDYDKELKKEIQILNKRKARMDEVNEYYANLCKEEWLKRGE